MKFLAEKVAEELKKRVEKDGVIDVGNGAEREYAVTRERFRKALRILQNEGYAITIFHRKNEEAKDGKWIVIKLLSKNSNDAANQISKNWKKLYEKRMAIAAGVFE